MDLVQNKMDSYQYDESTSQETSSNEQLKSVELITTTTTTIKQVIPEFKKLMMLRKNETADFKYLITTIALVIISLGLVANLLFTLLIMCHKRKRQTYTTLIMFSMCIAYFVYLCFYCLKLSVYFSGDSITKFHMYDTIDNWVYGEFLCRLVSGLPFCCKLVSRLSILTIIAKRFFNLFICDCTESNESNTASQVDTDDFDSENTKLNEIGQQLAKLSQNKRTQNKSCKKIHLLKIMFKWPTLLLIITSIWLLSVGITFPIFNSFKLNEPSSNSIQTSTNICNSVFRFPEDIKLVSKMYFNYFIYAFILPCGLIFTFLIGLFMLQSKNCSPMSRVTKSGNASLSSTSSSPKISKSKEINSNGSTSTSSSASFDEITNNNQQCSTSLSSNNLLLWNMFFIHLITTLPPEIYRYFQLRVDFNDETILDDYLTASLIQPILKAKPYYALQLLYISEFLLMPLVFILFFLCSMKRSIPTRSESDADLPNNKKSIVRLCTESSGCLRHFRYVFYDPELSKSKESKRYFLSFNKSNNQKSNQKSPIMLINDETKTNTESLLPAAMLNRENILSNNTNKPRSFPIITGNIRQPITNSSSSHLRPTPFELANNSNTNANLVHIIQHPSWRINIKQQQQMHNQEQTFKNENDFNSKRNNKNNQQLFSYIKS